MNSSAIVPFSDPQKALDAIRDEDELAVERMWLRKQSSPLTRDGYERDWRSFRMFLPGKPLQTVSLDDLQNYAESLVSFKPRTRARKLAAVRSFFRLANQLGYLRFDPARMLTLPRVPNDLAERILDEAEVQRMLALEEAPRNQALLRTIYVAGLRVSEACGLRWRHVQAREAESGQITVTGKGDRTRAVLLTRVCWQMLLKIRPENPAPDDPVFVSQRKCALTRSAVARIVRAAAVRAGIELRVSPHWLRHCHVSHSLDRSAPIHLVSATVGHASIATTGKYAHARPNDSSSRYIRA